MMILEKTNVPSEHRVNVWFNGGAAVDAEIRQKFSEDVEKAISGAYDPWVEDPRGRLASIILLDQFSRNIHRNHPHSFANDPLALVLAQSAIARGCHLELPETQRSFFFMPLMHSESSLIHREAVKLFEELGNPRSLDFELRHQAIIDRFGRYPHRNEILGRVSTAEEIEFLKQPNSSF